MSGNKAVSYQGPGKVEVIDIDYPTFELKDGPGVNPADLATLGFADGDVVDLVSEFADDADRRAPGFRVVAYDTARGCAAAYFPETNVLVPLDSTADRSNTPTSKSVVVRLERPIG